MSRTNIRPASNGRRGSTIHHRDDLIEVQKELAEIPGVTVLIYDQTCAAEKRRRRKRHTFPDPDKRVIINELVCEGCGDCGVQSNCVSVQPLETEWGRKRTIDQSSCNKDFSCVKGFCPSFVTVHGAKLKKGAAPPPIMICRRCPSRNCRPSSATYNIIVTGVGGTGVVTIGGILGMAAHLEGRGVGCSTWPAWRRRAARCSATCALPRIPTPSTPSASPPAAPIWFSAATSWSPARARSWPR